MCGTRWMNMMFSRFCKKEPLTFCSWASSMTKVLTGIRSAKPFAQGTFTMPASVGLGSRWSRMIWRCWKMLEASKLEGSQSQSNNRLCRPLLLAYCLVFVILRTRLCSEMIWFVFVFLRLRGIGEYVNLRPQPWHGEACFKWLMLISVLCLVMQREIQGKTRLD